jgi:hypothetical protein
MTKRRAVPFHKEIEEENGMVGRHKVFGEDAVGCMDHAAVVGPQAFAEHLPCREGEEDDLFNPLHLFVDLIDHKNMPHLQRQNEETYLGLGAQPLLKELLNTFGRRAIPIRIIGVQKPKETVSMLLFHKSEQGERVLQES